MKLGGLLWLWRGRPEADMHLVDFLSKQHLMKGKEQGLPFGISSTFHPPLVHSQ